jgi:Holliday junction resolvase RusA-like endonuclease
MSLLPEVTGDLFEEQCPSLVVKVPGEPIAQGRPRAFSFFGRDGRQHTRVYDPPVSRSWKGAAQVHMREALDHSQLNAPAFPDGPVRVEIEAVFTCPRTDYRKRNPRERRAKTSKPDIENVGKALMDAANGILWTDDSQVAELTIRKITGAQGEAPYVQATVRAL